MCNDISMIVVNGREEPVWFVDTDSHEELRKRAGLLSVTDALLRNQVAVEVLPLAGRFSTKEADWQFRVDEEGTLPGWFDMDEWRRKCIRTVCKKVIPKERRTGKVGSLTVKMPLQAPWLTSVGGNLFIHEKASLPALTSVGSDLLIREKASLPALTSVGGRLYVTDGVEFDAPNLKTVNGRPYKAEMQDAEVGR